MEQSLDDLHSLVAHFSNGKKVNLIGHSWGAMLVVGYLSKHPEMISQAVIVEPGPLYPGAPVKEWIEKVKRYGSFWSIARYLPSFPFVVKEDGQEGYDYVGTKIATRHMPGPPFNCEGQDLPPNIFKRFGYQSYNSLIQPVMDNPDLFTWDLTNGITEYHGDLMLMSSECSILGYVYQEKYNLPKLPAQTVHIKAERMGHHMITLNPEWSLQTIRNFFKH
jgi:proline iminopeptidase